MTSVLVKQSIGRWQTTHFVCLFQVVPEVGKEYTRAHPIMGIVIAALTVINVGISLSPLPGNKGKLLLNFSIP